MATNALVAAGTATAAATLAAAGAAGAAATVDAPAAEALLQPDGEGTTAATARQNAVQTVINGTGTDVAAADDGATGAKSLTTSMSTTTTGPTPAQVTTQGPTNGSQPAAQSAAQGQPNAAAAAGATAQAVAAAAGTTTVAAAPQADGHAATVAPDASADAELQPTTQQAGTGAQGDSESPEDAQMRLTGLQRASEAAGAHGADGRAKAAEAQAGAHGKAAGQVPADAHAAPATTTPAAPATTAAAAPATATTTGETPATTATATAQTRPTEGPAGGMRAADGGHARMNQERIDNIAAQLATRMRLSQAAGGSQVHLSLRPRELGDVQVQMMVRDGNVAATVVVDRADTGRVLQSNLDDLRRSLEAQGLNIDSFNVDVRDGDARTTQGTGDGTADGSRRTNAGSDEDGSDDPSALPGLSGDATVTHDDLHTGNVSVLA